jgi:hypothetical protein
MDKATWWRFETQMVWSDPFGKPEFWGNEKWPKCTACRGNTWMTLSHIMSEQHSGEANRSQEELGRARLGPRRSAIVNNDNLTCYFKQASSPSQDL